MAAIMPSSPSRRRPLPPTPSHPSKATGYAKVVAIRSIEGLAESNKVDGRMADSDAAKYAELAKQMHLFPDPASSGTAEVYRTSSADSSSTPSTDSGHTFDSPPVSDETDATDVSLVHMKRAQRRIENMRSPISIIGKRLHPWHLVLDVQHDISEAYHCPSSRKILPIHL